MIKSKKQMFIVISVFTLVMLLGTVTFAFFNYTRTGSQNIIRVGRLSFVSENEQTISLTNVFPIDPTDSSAMNNPTKVGTYEIEVKGDTDYVDGIEYLVSVVDANIYTNQGQIVPISINVSVNNLGNESSTYFTSREAKNANIYKRLSGNAIVGNHQLLVGYIKPNTTVGTKEGVNGSITIKAYIDKNKIAISDTYDGTESDESGTTSEWVDDRVVITTAEWNALKTSGVSFKIKVEANNGIWVKESLYEVMKKNAVMDNIQSINVSSSTGIDFSKVSGDTDDDNVIDNGEGLYVRAGTENDAYPIVYYRGNINNNNVLFANKCWQIVRTTDTGGTKMIYNGERSTIYSREYTNIDTYISENAGDTFTYDNNDNTFNYVVADEVNHNISFKIPAGNNTRLYLEGTTYSNCGVDITIYKNGASVAHTLKGGGATINNYLNYGAVTSDDVLKVEVKGKYTSPTCSINLKLYMSQETTNVSKSDYSVLTNIATDELGCDNNGSDRQIKLNIGGTDTNAFMFNSNPHSPAHSGYMYDSIHVVTNGDYSSGSKFGNSVAWDGTNYTITDVTNDIDSTHHYTCGTSGATTCSSIRYYFTYYMESGFNYYYYFTLSDGKTIEDVVRETSENGSNDSNAKAMVDRWYEENIYNTVYENKIEDTVYCNDRTIYRLGGMNPNGGALDATGGMIYSSYYRYVLFNPTTKCQRTQDSYTKSTSIGNGLLDYSIGLITLDEIALSGGKLGTAFTDYYLYTGTNYWTMSPHRWKGTALVYFFIIEYTGKPMEHDQSYVLGLRPVISLEQGISISSGTGTAIDPYVID